MGWKGTVQSICAASGRRYARYDTLPDRELPPSDPIPLDWADLLTKRPPPKPVKLLAETVSAEAALRGYYDTFLGTRTKQVQADIAALQNKVVQAKARDDERYRKRLAIYEAAKREWVQDRALAQRVLAGQDAAFEEVGQELQNRLAETFIGAEPCFSASHRRVHVMVKVPSFEVVLTFLPSLMLGRAHLIAPRKQAITFYKRYVEAVADRLSQTALQVLPVFEVYVTCRSKVMDRSAQEWVHMPLLSLRVVRVEPGQTGSQRAACWLFDLQ